MSRSEQCCWVRSLGIAVPVSLNSEQAERETRHKLLLQRARERDGAAPEPLPEPEQEPVSQTALATRQPAAQSFTLFSSDDLTADNSEVQPGWACQHAVPSASVW